jgi:ketosteroid isomerase-like protein
LQRIHQATLILLLVLVGLTALPSSADEATDRKALQAIYTTFITAFDQRDPAPILGYLSPDFELLTGEGRKIKRPEYEESLRSIIPTVVHTRIDVETLSFTESEAIALTTEHQTCHVPVGAGKVVTVHATGRARTWWQRTPEGAWKMKSAQLLETHTKIE